MFRNPIGVLALVGVGSFSATPRSLFLEKTIPFGGLEGRIDHMAADVNGGRLFVAASGNKTLEVLDWSTGKSDQEHRRARRAAEDRVSGRYQSSLSSDRRRPRHAYLRRLVICAAPDFQLGDDADNMRFDPDSRFVRGTAPERWPQLTVMASVSPTSQ
jgi:hypothetical protein